MGRSRDRFERDYPQRDWRPSSPMYSRRSPSRSPPRYNRPRRSSRSPSWDRRHYGYGEDSYRRGGGGGGGGPPLPHPRMVRPPHSSGLHMPPSSSSSSHYGYPDRYAYQGDRGDYRGGGSGGGGGPSRPFSMPSSSQGGSSRRRHKRDETPPGVSLLVRNLSTEITTSDLQAAFERIGEIRDVYIPLDYHSRQPKGFAFIEYATHEQAKAARDEMDKFKVKGRELEVVFAQEKRKTPGEMKIRSDSPGRGRDGTMGYGRSSSFDNNRSSRREGGRRSHGR